MGRLQVDTGSRAVCSVVDRNSHSGSRPCIVAWAKVDLGSNLAHMPSY